MIKDIDGFIDVDFFQMLKTSVLYQHQLHDLHFFRPMDPNAIES